MPPSTTYTVDYQLALQDGEVIAYRVEIDRKTLVSRIPEGTPPEWAKMSAASCEHCPLKKEEYCPIALRLAEPLRLFNGLVSHAPALTTVKTEERDYVKQGDVQDALRSLFGLIMATSGCPSLHPFRAMARFHLPFSTVEETVWRITSSYLLQELFLPPDDRRPTEIEQIQALFATMQQVNQGIIDRLKVAVKSDGLLNAVVILNTYSSLIPIIIEKELAKLAPLFSSASLSRDPG